MQVTDVKHWEEIGKVTGGIAAEFGTPKLLLGSSRSKEEEVMINTLKEIYYNKSVSRPERRRVRRTLEKDFKYFV